MKKKELNNLREKKLKELVKIAQERKLELAKTSAQIKAGKVKNIKKKKNLKIDIAQIMTVIREKEIFEKEREVSDK